MGEAKTKSVLRHVGTATINASATPFDPSILVERRGVFVYNRFVERVHKYAKPAESMGALALPYSDLEEEANDAEIGAALGDGYEFSETKVCYAIDRLIARQPNGEEGDLLVNGNANLFYVVGGPIVCLNWSANYRRWSVYDQDRDDNKWFRDRRAFRCN